MEAIARRCEHQESQLAAASATLPMHLIDFLVAKRMRAPTVIERRRLPGDAFILAHLLRGKGLLAIKALLAGVRASAKHRVFAGATEQVHVGDGLFHEDSVAEAAIKDHQQPAPDHPRSVQIGSHFFNDRARNLRSGTLLLALAITLPLFWRG